MEYVQDEQPENGALALIRDTHTPDGDIVVTVHDTIAATFVLDALNAAAEREAQQ
jgi:hypothetical protein